MKRHLQAGSKMETGVIGDLISRDTEKMEENISKEKTWKEITFCS